MDMILNRHNFAGSKIGRASARPEGVRARDGAHQDAKNAKYFSLSFIYFFLGDLGALAVKNIFKRS
jgi:hypothetical protein